MSKVTLKDIAEKVGVSISTVSRVVNHDQEKPASKKTADKVWAAVKEMDYMPDERGRRLVLGEDKSMQNLQLSEFGCICSYSEDHLGESFFHGIVSGVKEQLEAEGLKIRYVYSVHDTMPANRNGFYNANPVDGVILMGRYDREMLDELVERFSYIVYVGNNPLKAGFDEVISNAYSGIEVMVSYLESLGHKKIGFIGNKREDGPENLINEYRYDGYCDALLRLRLPNNLDYFINVQPYPESAYEGVKAYMQKKTIKDLPSAFVCTNDFAAIGAMKAFRECGILIPDQLSITGFDNQEAGNYVSPALTTVEVPKVEMGKMAVRILLDRIKYKRDYPVRAELPYELVFRDSVREVTKQNKG